MKLLRYTYFVMFVGMVLFPSISLLAQKAEVSSLWYDQPAKSWMKEALPIGNGYMGAMIFGGVMEEHIQFNEETLWSGGKGGQ